MAKKNQKKKNKSINKIASPQDSQKLLEIQKEALSSLRGRKASTLGAQIFADETLDETVRYQSLAVGHEAYLRELQSRGHTVQMQDKADILISNEPRLTTYWALSLQLRLGLVPDLSERMKDKVWLEKLRAELVDPSDLCGVQEGELGQQADRVMQAWALIEKGDSTAALELLKGVGRRSPLVDWRLFLQVLSSLRRTPTAEVESTLDRMRTGSPAEAAARALWEKQKSQSGAMYRRLKALEDSAEDGRLKPTDYGRLQSLVRTAVKENRPGLAITVVSAFSESLKTSKEANRYFSSLERFYTNLFCKDRICIRLTSNDDPVAGLLYPEVEHDIRSIKWDSAELGRVWARYFKQFQNRWDQMEEWETDEPLDGLLLSLLDDCRRVTQSASNCREIYEFWIWAEEEVGWTNTESISAYANAFPDDPRVLKMAALELAKSEEFNRADTCIGQLKKVLNSAGQIKDVEQSILVIRAEQSFLKQDTDKVDELAETYSGNALLEQIKMAFMRWRLAGKGAKRMRGQQLAEFNLPWLVLCIGCEIDKTFKATMLPAGMKRAMNDDPEAVLQSYLTLLKLDEKKALNLEFTALFKPICEALEQPGISASVLRMVLMALLLRYSEPEEIFWATDGLTDVLTILLDRGGDDQAMAILLRIYGLAETDAYIAFKKAQRSLRVAWTLAESEETRQLVSRIYNKCLFPSDEFPQTAASKKMIQAELNMQRKFKNLGQVADRYFAHEPRSGNPFGDIDIEKLKRILDADCDEDEETELGNNPFSDIFEPEPLTSQPYVFPKYPPTLEFEFESHITNIKSSTFGTHRIAAATTLKELIEQSPCLSTQAKARLMMKQQDLLEGA